MPAQAYPVPVILYGTISSVITLSGGGVMKIIDATTGNRLRIGFWGSGMIFLWMGSALFLMKVLSEEPDTRNLAPSLSDLATVFFGASSLALIIFSLLVAVAALIQWQSVETKVQRLTEAAEAALARVDQATQDNENRVSSLEERMKKKLGALEAELRGRVDAVMGTMIGNLNSNPTSPVQREEDKDYISEAIHYAQRGFDRLKELDGNGKYMALNSLVYYSCLLGSNAKSDLLLEQGKVLRDVGRKYEHLPYAAPYLLSFCRVELVYGTDLADLKQALAIAQGLLEMKLTPLIRKEAAYLVASLTEKLTGLSGSQGGNSGFVGEVGGVVDTSLREASTREEEPRNGQD